MYVRSSYVGGLRFLSRCRRMRSAGVIGVPYIVGRAIVCPVTKLQFAGRFSRRYVLRYETCRCRTGAGRARIAAHIFCNADISRTFCGIIPHVAVKPPKSGAKSATPATRDIAPKPSVYFRRGFQGWSNRPRSTKCCRISCIGNHAPSRSARTGVPRADRGDHAHCLCW